MIMPKVTRLIVKVQLPVVANTVEDAVLVYNQDRSIEFMTSDPKTVADVKDAMDERVKQFFYASVDQDQMLVLEELAPWQNW